MDNSKKKLLQEALKLKKVLSAVPSKGITEDVDLEKSFIEPGLAALDQVASIKGELPPIEFEDLIADIEPADLPKISDEDAETGIDGSIDITESIKRGELVLTEASAYKQAVQEYVDEVGIENAGTYRDYTEWCATSQPAKDPIPGQNFRKFLNELKANQPEEPATPKAPYQMSAALSDLVDACNEGGEFVESAVNTVHEKYDNIERKLKRVITGRSMKNYYLLFGDAGIGKTKTVEKCLEKCGYTGVPQIKGDVGKSRTDVAMFLYKYKDDELVVLDDCDSMINIKGTDPAVMNMLKGAMDPDSHTVTISPTVQKLCNNRLADLYKGPANTITGSYKVLRDGELLCSEGGDILFIDPADAATEDIPPMLFNSKAEAQEFITEDNEEGSVYEVVSNTSGDTVLMYEDGQFSDDGETLDTTKAEFPSTWKFNCRVIFVSNLDTKDINPAVISRCDYYCLHLTQEEYMVRLAEIIDDMKFDLSRTGWSEESVRKTKAFVVSLMASVIEAANNGVMLMGKKVVLTHPLEFRLVRDLIEGQMMLIEDYIEENPDATEEEARRATLKTFIRAYLLPKL